MNRVEVTRREIRERAIQTLYSLDFHEDISLERAILLTLSLHDEEYDDIPSYLFQVLEGVQKNQMELDQLISEHLKGWTLPRLSKVDLMILRLAVYEILHEDDVPNRVALNEALELAKTYSDDSSRKFINGVLSVIISEQK
ncbi:transcription antitermination factor NusB [Vagococcus lutrae]|uniref:transcription antitermination factor NusB n=1 Tax=Vagococcus lutrae TaxID=81947 RepID=UPI00200E1C4E|nr:transcription antitermination factor NusB [Vagococcus lutrae]MDT2805803.1 transcription antitermination factor NusB [Vagococcus lutrae]MDT2807863.1 transcription antitermination factor NusB [Vagococcus lutrae]MDT2823998.1 transcription antitermination factor NusB [Vagococcus lutrae]MDT2826363.1 transcription antitermination factor NusB [Vagococcus lutrae]UQF12506.1 transcription antitermination factor NusB [Vagococcus lutrae]